jgi:hypothetical protein
VVVRLNEKWRVVECRAGVQWILQRRKSASDGGGWSSRSFCRTSEATRRLARQDAKPIDPETLVVLDRLREAAGEIVRSLNRLTDPGRSDRDPKAPVIREMMDRIGIHAEVPCYSTIAVQTSACTCSPVTSAAPR